MTQSIYKICPRPLWEAACEAGAFTGAGIDIADGYIHFSTAAQAGETAQLHFRGQADLVLLTVETASLGDALKWEPSRGGDLFPHLYADLPVNAVTRTDDLPLNADGVPQMPAHVADEAA